MPPQFCPQQRKEISQQVVLLLYSVRFPGLIVSLGYSLCRVFACFISVLVDYLCSLILLPPPKDMPVEWLL